MTETTRAPAVDDIEYPDSDGLPIAENTLQFEWITTAKLNLDPLFADRPDVFVAGDRLWYPVRGERRFYDRYGVEEYYVYDPDNPWLEG
jgi:hypothetical protein